MISLRFLYGFLVVFPVSQQFPYDFLAVSMASLCFPYDFPKVFLKFPYSFPEVALHTVNTVEHDKRVRKVYQNGPTSAPKVLQKLSKMVSGASPEPVQKLFQNRETYFPSKCHQVL